MFLIFLIGVAAIIMTDDLETGAAMMLTLIPQLGFTIYTWYVLCTRSFGSLWVEISMIVYAICISVLFTGALIIGVYEGTEDCIRPQGMFSGVTCMIMVIIPAIVYIIVVPHCISFLILCYV